MSASNNGHYNFHRTLKNTFKIRNAILALYLKHTRIHW